VIEDEIKRPISEELLFGKLENGGQVLVDVETGAGGEEKLVFRYG
jgi:ATP-dependent Clp protease ATP-binding subunit ClpA